VYDPSTDIPPGNGGLLLWHADVYVGGMPWSWDTHLYFLVPGGNYTKHWKVAWYFNSAESEWRVDFLFGTAGIANVVVAHRFVISGDSDDPPGFHDQYERVIGDGSIKDVYVRHAH